MIPDSTLTLKNIFPYDLQQISLQVFKQDFFVSLLEIPRIVRNSDYLQSWLCSREYETYQRYKLEKRKNEYLAGRVSAKLATMHMLPCSFNQTLFTDIEISNQPSGRPYIRLPGKTPEMLDISISHSGSYACCLAANAPCGIDIQSAKPTLEKVQEKYCTNEEKALFNDCEKGLLQLAILWASKEAVKKCLACQGDMPGFLDISLHHAQSLSDDIRQLDFTLLQTGDEISVIARLIDRYALAMTIAC